MSPWHFPPPDASTPVRREPYVAAVRPFDVVAPTDGHPMARVRLSNGCTYVGWRHVRHESLADYTHQPLQYWLAIDRYAQEVVRQIHTLVAAGTLPRDVLCFSDLHYHMDANEGWGEELDALTPDGWAAVQERVTDILRSN